MAEEQNIKDIFDRIIHRLPTPGELAQFLDSSNYAVERSVRFLPEYNLSMEYRERASRIRELGAQIFGALYGEGGTEATWDQISQWVRAGVTDTEILYNWRQGAAYKGMYAGKPATMSEAEYRKTRETRVVEEQGVREAFSTLAGKNLTDDDLNKIFYGGPGSDDIRKEYTRVKGLAVSYQAQQKRGAATQVQATPFGPVQPLMRGIQTLPGQSEWTGGPVTQQEQSTPNARWLSYADYVAGKENPQWKAGGSGFVSPPAP